MDAQPSSHRRTEGIKLNQIRDQRVWVEHAFGAQHTMGDHTAFTIGIARAKVKIGMMSLIYNMKRQGQSSTHDVQAANGRKNQDWRVASIAA